MNNLIKSLLKTLIFFGKYTFLGRGALKRHLINLIEFITKDPGKNPLMGWESSSDMYSELKLEFKSKDLAIEYAKKNNIDFEVIEPQKRKLTKKSYADNFIK